MATTHQDIDRRIQAARGIIKIDAKEAERARENARILQSMRIGYKNSARLKERHMALMNVLICMGFVVLFAIISTIFIKIA